MSILLRTALLSWLVTMITLLTFIAVVVPSQKAAFLENLQSKAHGVSASLQDIAAGAAVSEDYSAMVDHCAKVLAEDSSIEYIIFTRRDGFSLVHERNGWRREDRAGEWNPQSREPRAGIRRAGTSNEVYNLSRPFDYSGIEWGWIHVGLSLDSYRRNVHDLYRQTGLAVLLCVALALLASIIYARRLTRPIVHLRRAVQKVAAGDLSVRAPASGGDEVGELAQSFNRMTESLLQRDFILQSVRFAAQQFLAADDWRTVIDDVLALIGKASGASRVSVFENRRDQAGALYTSQRHEWVAASVVPWINRSRFRDIPVAEAGLSRWERELAEGRTVVGHASSFPGSERALLEQAGVLSMVLVPIIVGGEWWGVIAVNECQRVRTWSDAEIASFRAAADTLGAAIDRHLGRDGMVRAKEVAESASRAKSQFLANMSHEIRTPITGVMGMLHLLRRTSLDTRQARYISNALVASETLLTVIGDVLDFSRIEAGRLELDEKRFDVQDTIDSAVRMFAERAEVKGVELAYRVSTDVPHETVGDPNRLRQILVNLIGNALKFTERGQILVDCTREQEVDGGVVLGFSVQDTGCGISEVDQKKIFEAFAQADGSMTRAHGGAGLGLAISRQLADLMGGGIRVESRIGEGSTFRFTVRLRTVEPVSASRPQDLLGLRVLVVDDCPTTREILGEYITSWKGVVETAADGALALEELKQAADRDRPIQVAVLDWKMPGLDGLALARLICKDPILAKTGLVLLSSLAFSGQDSDGTGGLFAATLPKPARKSELYNAIVTAAKGNLRGRAGLTDLEPQAAPQPVKVPPAVVLLVEDNEINREVAQEMLRELGCTCRYASNGREAVAAIESGGLDLVLMDCQMPVMDGYEATRLVRSREARNRSPRLPIIALTAHAMKGDREVCLAAGMDDFLTKPLEPGELAAMITKWVAARSEAGGAEPTVVREAPPAAPPNPPAPAPQGMSTIDYEELLTRVMGKRALADRLIGMFHDRVRTDLAEIETAVNAGDAKAIEAKAHRLKGSAANVSAESIRAIAAELEAAGRDGGLEGTAEMVERLRAAIHALLAELDGAGRDEGRACA